MVVLHHWTGEYFKLNADACTERIGKGQLVPLVAHAMRLAPV